MLLSERQLRKIIRELIISESFMTTKVEHLASVSIDGKKYRALGYSLLEKELPSDSLMNYAQSLTNIEKNLDFVILQIPREDAILSNIAGTKFALLDGEVLVRNSGTKFKLNTDIYNKNKNSKTKIVAFPIGEAIRKKHKVKFSSEKIDLGGPSGADYTIEIAGVLGMIPGFGEPFDAASAILAIAKDPPDYILGAISLLCAVPIIGTVVAVVGKPLARKFGKEGAEKIGNELGESLLEKGIKFDADAAKIAKNEIDESINTLKEVSEDLSRKIGLEANDLSKRFDELSDVAEKIIDNMSMDNFSRKTGERLISKTSREFTEAALKKELTQTLVSMTEGPLRKTISNYVSKFNKRMLDERAKAGYKSAQDALRSATSEAEKIKILKDALKDHYGSVFQGKNFPRPKPPGGYMKFDSPEEVFEFASSDVFAKAFGIPAGERTLLSMWEYSLREGAELVPATEMQVNMVVKNVLDKFKDIKITAATSNKQLADVGLDSATFGHALRSKMALNLNMKRLLDMPPDTMVQTFEHELLHLADRCILTALAGGKEFAQNIIQKELSGVDFSKRMASEFLSRAKSLDPDMPPIAKQSLDKLYIKNVAAKKLFEPENMKAIFGGTSIDDIIKFGKRIDDIGEWRTARHKIVELCDLNPMHANMVMQQIEFSKKSLRSMTAEQAKKEISSALFYHGNAAEIFVRVQRLSSFMTKKGYDISKLDDTLKFFREYGEGKADPIGSQLAAGVDDIQGDPFFQSIVRSFTFSNNYGFSSNLARKEAHAFLNSFL